MWLDDDVEATGAHETVCSWEGEVVTSHHFGNADCCRAGDAYATVHECCCAHGFATFWEFVRFLLTGDE